jgi:uncharacterized protein YndB with AHSA1/START domain
LKFLLTALTGVVALFALAWGIGALVPIHHVATRSARYAASPAHVWSVLSDFPQYPRWAPDVSGVRRLPDQAGHPVYALEGKWGMPLEIESSEPPRRLVTRIADPTLPFGGTWTWVVTREGKGARVTVTESGEIKPPPMRAMARFFLGYDATLDRYLLALGRGLKERVAPGPPPQGI